MGEETMRLHMMCKFWKYELKSAWDFEVFGTVGCVARL
jgi:hypothetical protein